MLVDRGLREKAEPILLRALNVWQDALAKNTFLTSEECRNYILHKRPFDSDKARTQHAHVSAKFASRIALTIKAGFPGRRP
jgi:hypothetical protein